MLLLALTTKRSKAVYAAVDVNHQVTEPVVKFLIRLFCAFLPNSNSISLENKSKCSKTKEYAFLYHNGMLNMTIDEC